MIYYGEEGKKKNLEDIEEEDVKQITITQLKILNEKGEKEYNSEGTKVLSENGWISHMVNKNIYLIEYGNKFKILEDITTEDIQEINNRQREKLYFLGNKKYGKEEWEKKLIDLDPYIIDDKPEWHVKNYDINDLYDLLDLEKEVILALSIVDAKQVIKNAVDKMIVALEQNRTDTNKDTIIKYKKFFDDVGKRLKVSIISPRPEQTPVSDNFLQKPDINKIKRSVISCAQTIIINSEIDVKIPPKTTTCPDDSFKYKVNRYQKTNFEVFLEFKLSNTSQLILGNVVIPLSGYFSIDPAYNTNTFTIKDNSDNTTNCIELEPQKPNAVDGFSEFIINFHDSLNSSAIFDLSLNYNSSAEKFELFTDSIEGYTINWIGGDCDIIYCNGDHAPTAKERPVSTLGFLMGYDTEPNADGEAPLIIKKNLNYVKAKRISSRMMGTSMFFLQFTDYTNSSINHNKVNISKPIQNFKQPYYFNSIRSRIGIDNSLNFCGKDLETNKRQSRKGTANNNIFNDLDTLTHAQKYSAKSNHAANKAVDTNNYTYPSNGPSKIIRFPIPARVVGGPGDKLIQPIQYSGGGGTICPIEYNGKADIIKIGIALYDQNDYLVDLNGEGIIVTFSADKVVNKLDNVNK